jgi:hypothetical protein
MRYIGKDFPLQDQTETAILAFDFTRHPDWKRWDSIVSATVSISVVSGTDASASSRLSGSPAYCEGVVKQTVAGPQSGVKYKLVATATMYSGEVLALYANLTGTS